MIFDNLMNFIIGQPSILKLKFQTFMESAIVVRIKHNVAMIITRE